eukprot:47882-Eustigmatos_ZCMA.PRE.1
MSVSVCVCVRVPVGRPVVYMCIPRLSAIHFRSPVDHTVLHPRGQLQPHDRIAPSAMAQVPAL